MSDYRYTHSAKAGAVVVLDALRSGSPIRLRTLTGGFSEGTLRRSVRLLRTLGAPIESSVHEGHRLLDPDWKAPDHLLNDSVIIERTVQGPERIRIVYAADMRTAPVSQLVAEIRRRGLSVTVSRAGDEASAGAVK